MLAPWSRSKASPSAIFSLASSRWISLTMPAHCSAKAASLPTRPPPPMMLTFIFRSTGILPVSSSVLQTKTRARCPCYVSGDGRHNLVRDRLHQRLHIRLAHVLRQHRVDRLLLRVLLHRGMRPQLGSARELRGRSGAAVRLHSALPTDVRADAADEI